jgi:hypothetical protein
VEDGERAPEVSPLRLLSEYNFVILQPMKITDIAKADSRHSRYTFAHKVKGKWITFDVVAFNQERALSKAWQVVKEMYRRQPKSQHNENA